MGAGGHAKVCYEIASAMAVWDDIIVLDDCLENDYFKISGPISDFQKYIDSAQFFVAIGNNDIRSKLIENLEEQNCALATLIHPSSIISHTVKIGHGSVIMPLVVVNAGTQLGKGIILNTSCSVDHDNYLHDYVHISPGCHLAGSVTVGQKTWIGIGTVIKQNISIGDNIVIGSGSNIFKNISESGTYVGNPLLKIKG